MTPELVPDTHQRPARLPRNPYEPGTALGDIFDMAWHAENKAEAARIAILRARREHMFFSKKADALWELLEVKPRE